MNRLSFSAILLILLSTTACVKTQAPAPAIMYGSTQGEGSVGVHTVVGNETLWDVSQRYALAMRDIAAVNNLSAPFDLSPGQRLRLPPPREYHVKAGDNLNAISKLFNVPMSDIAKLNSMKEPYTLAGGETLRLPTLTRETVAVPTARAPLPSVGAPAPAPLSDVYASDVFAQGTVADGGAVPPPVGKGEVLASNTKAPPVANQPITPHPSSVAPTPPPSLEDIKPEPIKVAQAPKVPEKKTPVTKTVPKRSSSKFLTPVDGKTISSYGPKSDGLHNDGINIKAAEGTPVKAAENGVVVYAGNELQASGNLIIIRHQDRWMTAYAHMGQFTVKRGDTVKRGQTIGTVGSTGSVDSPQLHFEVRRGTEAINPKLYLEG